MWNLGVNLVTSLVYLMNIPISNIRGHREFATYKSCPGNLFDIKKFQEDVARELQRKGGV
jgi:hypothetical protein